MHHTYSVMAKFRIENEV